MAPSGIDLDDLWMVGFVSLLAAYQTAYFARRVGYIRRKYKVEPPETTGPPEFVRTFRAQQNSIEFFGLFIVTMWMAALFFHQVPAAIAGLVYLYGRESYFTGYQREPKGRLSGFYLSIRMLLSLLMMSALGIAEIMVRIYANVSLKKLAYNALGWQ